MPYVIVLRALMMLACGEEVVPLTGTEPPLFATVVKVDKDAGFINYEKIFIRDVPEEQLVEENGKQVKLTTVRRVRETCHSLLFVRHAQVYDARGRRVAEADAWKRLAAGTTFLKSSDGKMVNKDYLSVVREETLILGVEAPANC